MNKELTLYADIRSALYSWEPDFNWAAAWGVIFDAHGWLIDEPPTEAELFLQALARSHDQYFYWSIAWGNALHSWGQRNKIDVYVKDGRYTKSRDRVFNFKYIE